MNRYYGKYRGTVVSNTDPLQLGRIQVSVPSVLGDGRMSWAMPCVPYAGPGVGLFTIPPIEANVWVEFEGGDTDSPIWTGCFWGRGEAPAMPAVADMKVLKTDGVTLIMNDTPGGGGLTIEVGPPAVSSPLRIVLDSSGIQLSNGAAKLQLSPASVSINEGALEVI